MVILVRIEGYVSETWIWTGGERQLPQDRMQWSVRKDAVAVCEDTRTVSQLD